MRPLRAIESRLHRLRLSVVARELEQHDARVGSGDRSCNLGSGVAAPVVHEHQLPRWMRRECVAHGIDERPDALLFVVERNDDREVGMGDEVACGAS